MKKEQCYDGTPPTKAELQSNAHSFETICDTLLWAMKHDTITADFLKIICKGIPATRWDDPREDAVCNIVNSVAHLYQVPYNDNAGMSVAERIVYEYDIQQEGGWLTW